MTCAKKVVKCWIVTKNQGTFYGENGCENPQETCPRAPDEGYAKCKTVCRQEGHAEEMALKAATGYDIRNAIAYMSGTHHYCESCQRALFDAGVQFLARGYPNA